MFEKEKELLKKATPRPWPTERRSVMEHPEPSYLILLSPGGFESRAEFTGMDMEHDSALARRSVNSFEPALDLAEAVDELELGPHDEHEYVDHCPYCKVQQALSRFRRAVEGGE